MNYNIGKYNRSTLLSSYLILLFTQNFQVQTKIYPVADKQPTNREFSVDLEII
jgi:hypothetical protein